MDDCRNRAPSSRLTLRGMVRGMILRRVDRYDDWRSYSGGRSIKWTRRWWDWYLVLNDGWTRLWLFPFPGDIIMPLPFLLFLLG